MNASPPLADASPDIVEARVGVFVSFVHVTVFDLHELNRGFFARAMYHSRRRGLIINDSVNIFQFSIKHTGHGTLFVCIDNLFYK